MAAVISPAFFRTRVPRCSRFCKLKTTDTGIEGFIYQWTPACLLLFIHRLPVFLGNKNLWWRVIDLLAECQGLSYYVATRTIVESRKIHDVEPVENGSTQNLRAVITIATVRKSARDTEPKVSRKHFGGVFPTLISQLINRMSSSFSGFVILFTNLSCGLIIHFELFHLKRFYTL